MRQSNVVHFQEPDEALAEERRQARSIVDGIRASDPEAEKSLVRRYERGLLYVVARELGDQEAAVDVVQDVFLIAIEKLRGRDLEQPERLAGYLRGIAKRTVLNAKRKRKREPFSLDIDATTAIPDQSASPFENIASDDVRDAVHETLRSLTVPRDREVLLRYYVHEENSDSICRELDIDRSYFNRVLFRARARFRKCLEDAGYDAALTTRENE